MNKNEQRICRRCVMDTTDPEIVFDDSGFCNHCNNFLINMKKYVKIFNENDPEFLMMIEKIKRNKKSEYDSILGLSGGVDSSFLAMKVKGYGLNPLIVHFDNGWNSEISVGNIEKIVRKLKLDLFTYVMDWNEFKQMQRAFFKASVIDVEMLTDHAIKAVIYDQAKRYKIKYILSGENFLTEGIMPNTWIHPKHDFTNIKDIVNSYSGIKIKSFPSYNLTKKIYYEKFKKLTYVKLLNHINYKREEALNELTNNLDFVNYGEKHHESVFTKFFQNFYLPQKFNIDKRKAHLSCLISNGSMAREEALKIINYTRPEEEISESDVEYVIKKLGFSASEFSDIMNKSPKNHYDFKNNGKIFYLLRKINRLYLND